MKHVKKMKELKRFCICASLYVLIIILMVIEAFTSSGGEMLSYISIVIIQFGLLLLTILEYLNYVNKKRVEQGLKIKETIIGIGTVVLSMIVLIVAAVVTSSEVEMLKYILYIIGHFCFLLFIIVEYLNYVKKTAIRTSTENKTC